MANGLSMKVLLQLQKQQFDKGIGQVQTSLANLGRTVKNLAGMFLGGLGLSALIGQFKRTSTELSVAKATLENTSKGFKEYSENMAFLKRIANEYGQDLISLTNGFAKFHAAAKQTSLSLDQQRYIFEALTRAAGAYHLSAEQTSNVMLAVEQMLSKGKVTAEELRRQLGNSLPGAFNLMAQAAGVSTAELDRLMKAGQVISEDVLPKFAQVLNATTTAANFDSLQSSLNRFKNAWVDFVDNSGFEDFFKGIVDRGTKSLNYLSKHFRDFVSLVAGGLVGIGTGKSFRALEKEGDKSLSSLRAKTKAYEGQVEDLDKSIANLVAEERALESKTYHLARPKQLTKEKALMMGITDEEWKQAKWSDEALRTKTFIVNRDRELKTIDSEINALQAQKAALGKEQIKNQVMLERSTTAWGRALNGLSSMWTSVLTTIKSIAASLAAGLAVGVIITALTHIIQKVVQWREEQKRVKNMVEDTQAAAEKAAGTVNDQIGKMEALYKIASATTNSESLRVKALKQINQLLGNEKFELQDIEGNANKVRDAIDEWKDRLIKAARASAYFSQIQKLEAERIEIETKRNEEAAKPQTITAGYGVGYTKWEEPTKAARKVAEYDRKIQALDDSIENLLNKMKDEDLTDPFSEDGLSENTVEAVREALDGYDKSVENLKKKLERGDISQKKFNRDMNKLREDTTKTIQKYEDWEDALEGLGPEYEKLYNSLTKVETVNQPLEDLRKDIDKFKQQKDALDRTLAAGAMSGEEYAKSLETLVKRYKDNIIGADDLAGKLVALGPKYQAAVEELNAAITDIELFDAIEEYIKEQDKVIEEQFNESIKEFERYDEKFRKVLDTPFPKRKLRDNFFDYKATGSEQLEDSADLSDRWLEELQKYRDMLLDIKSEFGYLDPYLQRLLDRTMEQLTNATKQANELNDAAKLAKLKEDIAELKKQKFDNLFDAIAGSGGIGALESVHRSLTSIAEDMEAIDDADSAWEAFGYGLRILGDFAESIEAVITAVKTWQTVMETATMLMKAQETEQAALSTQKIAALGAEVAAEGASATETVAAENAKSVAASQTSAALAQEAVAGAAASQAAIPVAGPVLAAAAVAAIMGLLMANMSKFAKGGIVGGNSTNGDQNLVRANSGEMILTKGQQANLWGIINGKGKYGGDVEFKIRGADLVGAINNYQSRRRG